MVGRMRVNSGERGGSSTMGVQPGLLPSHSRGACGLRQLGRRARLDMMWAVVVPGGTSIARQSPLVATTVLVGSVRFRHVSHIVCSVRSALLAPAALSIRGVGIEQREVGIVVGAVFEEARAVPGARLVRICVVRVTGSLAADGLVSGEVRSQPQGSPVPCTRGCGSVRERLMVRRGAWTVLPGRPRHRGGQVHIQSSRAWGPGANGAFHRELHFRPKAPKLARNRSGGRCASRRA